jgi:hypothetical protein
MCFGHLTRAPFKGVTYIIPEYPVSCLEEDILMTTIEIYEEQKVKGEPWPGSVPIGFALISQYQQHIISPLPEFAEN